MRRKLTVQLEQCRRHSRHHSRQGERVSVRFLLGDVNGSLDVATGDADLVKAQVGATGKRH